MGAMSEELVQELSILLSLAHDDCWAYHMEMHTNDATYDYLLHEVIGNFMDAHNIPYKESREQGSEAEKLARKYEPRDS
jgi:hypothetical protein